MYLDFNIIKYNPYFNIISYVSDPSKAHWIILMQILDVMSSCPWIFRMNLYDIRTFKENLTHSMLITL